MRHHEFVSYDFDLLYPLTGSCTIGCTKLRKTPTPCRINIFTKGFRNMKVHLMYVIGKITKYIMSLFLINIMSYTSLRSVS